MIKSIVVFAVLIVLFLSCTHPTEPPPRVTVMVTHHVEELTNSTLAELQSVYSPVMLYIGGQTVNTIPVGMQLSFNIPVGTNILAHWMECDEVKFKHIMKYENLIVAMDTVWTIGKLSPQPSDERGYE